MPGQVTGWCSYLTQCNKNRMIYYYLEYKCSPFCFTYKAIHTTVTCPGVINYFLCLIKYKLLVEVSTFLPGFFHRINCIKIMKLYSVFWICSLLTRIKSYWNLTHVLYIFWPRSSNSCIMNTLIFAYHKEPWLLSPSDDKLRTRQLSLALLSLLWNIQTFSYSCVC